MLRSIEISGFGNLALSLSSKSKLDAEINAAVNKALKDGGDGAGGGLSGSFDDSGADAQDARNGRGLYEYTPWEKLNIKSMDNIVDYGAQYRQIINAYFIINEKNESTSTMSNDMSDSGRKINTKIGVNVILHGPPGTGKTLAAKAIARTLRLNFVFVNAESILSAYRSETEKNLQTLYSRMRALCVQTKLNTLLLMDKIDGIVKSRSATQNLSSADYGLLTKFLTILEPNDGSNNFNIMSIFTTNNLSNLDNAFLRRCTPVFCGT